MDRYAIVGMTCAHCVRAVERALMKTPGVERATVDLADAIATVEGAPAEAAVLAAVRTEGYEARRL
jgi:copper chaperone CopZ